MEIKRNVYLNKLIKKENNGMIKVITGIRRAGKSYLLDLLFKNYLLEKGVKEDHIIKIEFDKQANKKFHNPDVLNEFLFQQFKDDEMYYVILDEIQFVEGFEFVLNGLLYEKNVDVYVTGSNSKFLSSDILTTFRGRGDQIHVNPLAFSEFVEGFSGDKYDAWREYLLYGGMPHILELKDDDEKSEYLKSLIGETYFKDIIERNNIKRKDVLDSIINMLASSVGSLTNTQKIYNTFVTKGEKEVSLNTINSYMQFLEEAFVVKKVERYDVKGKRYIQTPQKYYFADMGLRNARLNFRQQEENHLMENIIYNELIYRGYNVDVGVVEIRENAIRKQLEIDFVCNQGSKRYYIQSALNIDTPEKNKQESKSLNNVGDNFKKIIVVKDNIKSWYNEDGILVIGIIDFLLNQDSLDV